MQMNVMALFPPKDPLEAGAKVSWAISVPQALKDALIARAAEREMNASKYATALLIAAIHLEDADAAEAESKLTRPKAKR